MPAFFLNAAAQSQQRLYLDESGTLTYTGEVFTMAMVLVRDLPRLEASLLKHRSTQGEVKASQMKTAQKLELAKVMLAENDLAIYLVKLDPVAAMITERKLDKELVYDAMVAQGLAYYLRSGELEQGLPYRVSLDMRGGLRESFEDMVASNIATVVMSGESPLVSGLDVRFLDSKYSAGVQVADLFSNIYRTSLSQGNSPCTAYLEEQKRAGVVHEGFTFGLPELADQMTQIADELRARVEFERANVTDADGRADEKGSAAEKTLDETREKKAEPLSSEPVTASEETAGSDAQPAAEATADQPAAEEREGGRGTSRSARRRRSRAVRREREEAENAARQNEGAPETADANQEAAEVAPQDQTGAEVATASENAGQPQARPSRRNRRSAKSVAPTASSEHAATEAAQQDQTVAEVGASGAAEPAIQQEQAPVAAADETAPEAPKADTRPGRASRSRAAAASSRRQAKDAASAERAPRTRNKRRAAGTTESAAAVEGAASEKIGQATSVPAAEQAVETAAAAPATEQVVEIQHEAAAAPVVEALAPSDTPGQGFSAESTAPAETEPAKPTKTRAKSSSRRKRKEPAAADVAAKAGQDASGDTAVKDAPAQTEDTTRAAAEATGATGGKQGFSVENAASTDGGATPSEPEPAPAKPKPARRRRKPAASAKDAEAPAPATFASESAAPSAE